MRPKFGLWDLRWWWSLVLTKCQSFWNAPILLVLWPLSFPQATVLQTSQFESTDNLDQVCL
jgi:hypothetical protein